LKADRIIVPLCVLAGLALMVCLILERQACLKLAAQNDALRSQLERMAALTADNQRLSNLLAHAAAPRTNATADERLAELARLRQQSKDLQDGTTNADSLRRDTVALRAALEDGRKVRRASRQAALQDRGTPNDGSLQILSAQYGTDRTNMDVASVLNDRIRGGGLKAFASNNLNGDPDPGKVKNLTVIYRSGGTLMTNQFREGDMIILPPPAE